MRVARPLLVFVTVLLSVVGACSSSCKRAPAAPADPPLTPTLRISVVTTLAGALEPCGCVKDMLGGIDHAAALTLSHRDSARASLFVAAGPLLFLDPSLEPESRTQDLWKAETIAESLKDMQLTAWAPGANDWAAGADELGQLRKKTGAALLAANLKGAVDGAEATQIVEAGGIKLGITGVSSPLQSGLGPEGVRAQDVAAGLGAAKQSMEAAGAKLLIALLAMPRGEALRLVESVPGFQLVVIGKPVDRGEANDGVTPPVVLGDSLVVQTPNHLQAVATVDLYLRGNDFRFNDGAGLADIERREALAGRIQELDQRIALAEKPDSGVRAEDLAARRRDRNQLEGELGKLELPRAPAEGSFFRYQIDQVRDSLGANAAVTARMHAYYKRVNEHNRVAFADRKPPPVAPGESSYIGVERCGHCHVAEKKFWETTAHARAYVTLSRDDKQFNLDCVGCHVTGYGKAGGSTVTFVQGLESNQCENCHGPGSRHANAPSNEAFIIAKPKRSLCAAECHHPPHVKSNWSVDEAWKHIIGPGHGVKAGPGK